MTTKRKKSPAAADAAPALTAAEKLERAQRQQADDQAALAALRAKHRDQLEDMLEAADSEDAAAEIGKTQRAIDEIGARVSTRAGLIETLTTSAEEERRHARMASCAKDREEIVSMARQRAATLAIDVDKAGDAFVAAVERYVAQGDVIASLTHKTVSALNEGEFFRIQDALFMASPRAWGVNADTALAVRNWLQRVAALFGPEMEKWVLFKHAHSAPGLDSLAMASRNDAAWLAERFVDALARQPSAHRVMKRTFIDDSLREPGEIVMYAGPPVSHLVSLTQEE